MPDCKKDFSKMKITRILKYILYFIIVFNVVSAAIVLVFKWVDPPTTAFILFKSNEAPSDILTGGNVNQNWVPIDKISVYLPLAAVAFF